MLEASSPSQAGEFLSAQMQRLKAAVHGEFGPQFHNLSLVFLLTVELKLATSGNDHRRLRIMRWHPEARNLKLKRGFSMRLGCWAWDFKQQSMRPNPHGLGPPAGQMQQLSKPWMCSVTRHDLNFDLGA